MALNREFLVAYFNRIWPVHNRGFAALLIECRKHFGGDMDQMLILSVIGDRALCSGRASGLAFGKFIECDDATSAPRPINIQSVADSTGIPRESVRRKIERLIDRGWVERSRNGSLSVTRRAAVDLAPATEATFDYMLSLAEVLLHATRSGAAADKRGAAPPLAQRPGIGGVGATPRGGDHDVARHSPEDRPTMPEAP